VTCGKFPAIRRIAGGVAKESFETPFSSQVAPLFWIRMALDQSVLYNQRHHPSRSANNRAGHFPMSRAQSAQRPALIAKVGGKVSESFLKAISLNKMFSSCSSRI
jgi:hypothetical protein